MSICLLKRTIRIITSVFISICLIFVFSTVGIAEEYSISEIEAKLSIPDDWYTFSKHSTKDAYPYLDEGTFDACMSTFTTNPQVCLYAVSLETSSEILVVYNKNTANNGINFNSFSDNEFEEHLDDVKQRYADNGLTVTQCSLFRGTNTKYIKVLYSSSENDIYTILYYTCSTNNYINIIFNSFGDSINSNDEAIAKSVANSLTGLSDGLFEAKSISSSSNFNLEKPLSKALSAALVGGIFALIGKAFHSSDKKEEKIEDVQTAVTNGSEDTNTGKNSNEKPKNNFCRVCGEKLPDNSNFCSKCGAEVLNQYENGD